MIRRFLVLAGLLWVAGCEEELTVPGRCPELCPGGQPTVFDTVIPALEASDTTFFGYSGHLGITSLLVSNGLEAGEARAWVRFPERSDSITRYSSLAPRRADSDPASRASVARRSWW